MGVKLNHTIVHSRDQQAAAEFYSSVFGLPGPRKFGPFLDIDTGNEVADGELEIHHKTLRRVKGVM